MVSTDVSSVSKTLGDLIENVMNFLSNTATVSWKNLSEDGDLDVSAANTPMILTWSFNVASARYSAEGLTDFSISEAELSPEEI
ncbi:hypothetical protein J7337_009367 [Fusarium musae]|uniref:Uncharacterized protein n=1 Tax=Fusarium musae TaxID=1042133 RepID=A0A9P8IM72_9HYPO|nr:hypothetical protein J7337_009367 [Fusarium musae]KAG9498559.1 hypothetical protein J7337_009367 [Fusarium musae]